MDAPCGTTSFFRSSDVSFSGLSNFISVFRFIQVVMDLRRKKNSRIRKPPKSGEDQLIKELLGQLLAPDKTIRDAVHKDIFVTHLETSIMDTDDFQRLRRLKQLGFTNLVFPSANHTRFEHSIGTLYMTDYLIGEDKQESLCRFQNRGRGSFHNKIMRFASRFREYSLWTHTGR